MTLPLLLPYLLSVVLAVVLVAVIVANSRRMKQLKSASVAQQTFAKETGLTLSRILQAVESATDAIGVGDMEGVSLYHNRAHIELFGYTVDELNRTTEDMVLFADRKVALEIHTSIRAGRSWSGETEVRTKDGRRVPCFVRADIIRDQDGRPAGIFGVFTDITERLRLQRMLDKKAEEAARASRLESLGMLAGGIAHDFGNLITAMVMNIDLTKLVPGLPEDANRRLNELERTVWRANDVTKQLVAFAKGGDPKKAPVSVEALLREAAGYAVVGTRVSAEFRIAPELPRVSADEGQLVQVFNNICVNAVQAMPDGGQLMITAEREPVDPELEYPGSPRDFVRISISDTGTGIAPENLGKIFDPFFTTKEKGTGFGLATSYTIVEKHGGHLRVESALGKGTTFSMTLPVDTH